MEDLAKPAISIFAVLAVIAQREAELVKYSPAVVALNQGKSEIESGSSIVWQMKKEKDLGDMPCLSIVLHQASQAKRPPTTPPPLSAALVTSS